MIGWKRYALLGLLILVVLVSVLSMSEKQTTVFYGTCKGNGIGVTVRFTDHEVSRCVTGKTGTGWQVLKAAGFKVAGTPQIPVGFVCKIEGAPKDEDCKSVPQIGQPGWIYFVASPGDSRWHYSLMGSNNHTPECGSAELWVLGKVTDVLPIAPPTDKPRTTLCH